ncbi:hypothetical protein ACFL3C_00035 [Patescibacteria group bacterium]
MLDDQFDHDPSQTSDSEELSPEQVWGKLNTRVMLGDFKMEINMPEDSDGSSEVITVRIPTEDFLNLSCFPVNPDRPEPIVIEVEDSRDEQNFDITASHNFKAAQRVIWEKNLSDDWRYIIENRRLRDSHRYADSINEPDKLPEPEEWGRDLKTGSPALAYPAVVTYGHGNYVYRYFPYQDLAEEKQRRTDANIEKRHEEMIADVKEDHGLEMAERFAQTIEWVKARRGYCRLLLNKDILLQRTIEFERNLKEAKIFYNRDSERWEAMVAEGNSTNFYRVEGYAEKGIHPVTIMGRKTVSIYPPQKDSSEKKHLMLRQACPTDVVEDTRSRLKESQAAETPNEMKQRALATELANGAMPEEIVEHNKKVEEELRRLWFRSDCDDTLFNDHPLIKLDTKSTRATVYKDSVHFHEFRSDERNGVEIDWVEFYMNILQENEIYDASLEEVVDDFRQGYLNGKAKLEDFLKDFISPENRRQIEETAPETINVNGGEYNIAYTPTFSDSDSGSYELFEAEISMSRSKYRELESTPRLPTGQMINIRYESTW